MTSLRGRNLKKKSWTPFFTYPHLIRELWKHFKEKQSNSKKYQQVNFTLIISYRKENNCVRYGWDPDQVSIQKLLDTWIRWVHFHPFLEEGFAKDLHCIQAILERDANIAEIRFWGNSIHIWLEGVCA
jgi:hypothetical protein